MKIQIIKAHKCMKVGDTPDVAVKYAQNLIDKGIAVDPSKKTKAAKAE